MIQKYRNKSIVIEAIQYTDLESMIEIQKFAGDNLKIYQNEFSTNFTLIIHTPEGEMEVDFYDYIIKGINGEFYLCKSDIFENTYKKID